MSSNEQTVSELIACPFCGQKDAFVEQLDSDASVVICQGRVDEYSACLARGPVGVQQSHDEVQPGYAAAVAAWNLQAEQHKGDPVGKLMRDKYQNIVIVPIGDPHITDGMLVYASADASEVTRLRCEVSKWRGTAGRVTHERDSLRAQLAEQDALTQAVKNAGKVAHLYHSGGGLLEWINSECAALSTSAEPSTQVERDERALIELALSEFGKATGSHVLPGGFNDKQDYFVQGFIARAALERKP